MNMLPVCEEVIKDIQTHLFSFLWNGNPHKIASNVIIAPIKYGGLKMPDFSSVVRATQISWVPRIMMSNSRWNNIFQNAIQPITKEFLFQCKVNPTTLMLDYLYTINKYYTYFKKCFRMTTPLTIMHCGSMID
jgi:hypothetical protein